MSLSCSHRPWSLPKYRLRWSCPSPNHSLDSLLVYKTAAEIASFIVQRRIERMVRGTDKTNADDILVKSHWRGGPFQDIHAMMKRPRPDERGLVIPTGPKASVKGVGEPTLAQRVGLARSTKVSKRTLKRTVESNAGSPVISVHESLWAGSYEYGCSGELAVNEQPGPKWTCYSKLMNAVTSGGLSSMAHLITNISIR